MKMFYFCKRIYNLTYFHKKNNCNYLSVLDKNILYYNVYYIMSYKKKLIAYENGLKQKQILHDFDVTAYKKLNPDLQHMTDKEATIHYNFHGFYEGRKYRNVVITSDFYVTAYKKLNYDLQHMSDEEAMNHYKNYGFYEGRKYKSSYIPDDFDVTEYKNLYSDLQHMTHEEAINHYKNNGFYEGRIYSNYNVFFHNIEPLLNPSDISMFLSNQVIDYSKNSFIKANEIKENIPRHQHNSKEKLDSKLLSSFLLIVDFNNLGGGTSVFIETIISKYKKYKTFLIARNFNEQIIFTVNDDYELEQTYSQYDADIFLLNNKDKIEKIFVNHTMNHTSFFINSLFKLEKHISTITHDFSILFKDPQMYFNDIEKYILNKDTHNTVNINKYDQIITQNNANLYIYNNFIEDKNKIVVTPLPDFINSKDLIYTSNNNIVVGIIGAIADLKGSKDLEQLINYYKNTNVYIIVFGITNNNSIDNYYPYKNINELNDLLIIHKPNILIELSVWPETHSYTLTISMLTQLPILFLKKNGCSVIEDRLSRYNKAYSFETIDEFDNLIYSKKQNYFYTIEPVIYFNEFWDNYFLTSPSYKLEEQVITDDYKNRNIVLITSKIIVSNSPFSYIKNRSVYTKEERFSQTINTIKSIRKYVPNSYIVLVDNSELNKIECEVLNELTDYFINVTNDKELNYNTNENKIKMFGDISHQLCFYNIFFKNIDVSKMGNFFKISGRYLINNTFNYDDYNNNLNIFKKNEEVLNRDYYFTSFYKLTPDILIEYFESLNDILINKDIYNENTVNDIEVIVPNKIKNKNMINNLGITQIFSVWNKIDNI